MRTRVLWAAAAACVFVAAMMLAAHALAPQFLATWISTQTTAAVPTPKTADGNNADWPLLGIKPYIGNSAILATNGSETEWVWRDKMYDVRDEFWDAGGWWVAKSNFDLETIRIVADATYLYFYIEMDAFHGWDAGAGADGTYRFNFNVSIDTNISVNPAGGTAGMNWIGPTSNTVLVNPEQYSEYNYCFNRNGVFLYVPQTTSWSKKGNLGTDVGLNQAGGFVEARLKWSDMGFSSIPPRIRLTMANACNAHWIADPNSGDVNWPPQKTGAAPDMLDAVSFGLDNSTSEWWDELSDGNVFTSMDIAFDANGNCVNPNLPLKPLNLRVFDSSDSSWRTSGDTICTNNPLIRWDPVLPDSDLGDSITSYYVQISTKPAVNADGFFHDAFETVVAMNSGSWSAFNEIIYLNTYFPRAWLGDVTGETGIANGNGYGKPILQQGVTYFLRVWARDRRGMLGQPSDTFVLPIDPPAWHDPYVFSFEGSTFRRNRDPKEGDNVDFTIGVCDPPPRDPRDDYYVHAGSNTCAPSEILNAVLHIRVAKVGHFTYDWVTQAAKILLGNDSIAHTGALAWYRPSSFNAAYNIWSTGGSIDFSKTHVYKCNRINLGNNGGAETFKLQANPGDVVEYFFEINNATEEPGASGYHLSRPPRRYLHSYDTGGITGYRFGTYSEAQSRPFRFVVQRRDLTAVWHNPLSNEVQLVPGGGPFMMRTPPWPDTPQTVRMYIGAVGDNTINWRIVYRNVNTGSWTDVPIVGGVNNSPDGNIFYYLHNFGYTGGMVEYYFKKNSNDLYVFANGITNNADTVYENSIGNEGQKAIPFRFPFSSRIRVTSTASIGKDSHSIVAVLNFRTPRFEAFNENAVGVNKALDFTKCTVTVAGNVFTNFFPPAHWSARDTPGAFEPRKLFGRSHAAIKSGIVNMVSGIRKAFFGPIFPFDYVVTDSTRWNTGSDAYENVPILTYEEVFKDAIERKESPAPGTPFVFNAGQPINGVIYVEGDARIENIAVARGAVICSGSITIPAGNTVNATRLDLYSLGGPIYVRGTVNIDTGILFSNKEIIVETGALLAISDLGSVIAQDLQTLTNASVSVVHPASTSFIAAKESVLSRATRWVFSALRESR